MSGSIEAITGCMFAGKTEELLRRLRRAEIKGDQEIEIIKPEVDDRYGEETVTTHNGADWEATVIPSNRQGKKMVDDMSADVLAVDEFNFFNKYFLPLLQKKADNGTRVIIVGLDQTYRGEPFTPMENALAVADEVQKLTAICDKCGSEATKTQRLVDGEPAPEDMATIIVGGEESYEARCRDCHELK